MKLNKGDAVLFFSQSRNTLQTENWHIAWSTTQDGSELKMFCVGTLSKADSRTLRIARDDTTAKGALGNVGVKITMADIMQSPIPPRIVTWPFAVLLSYTSADVVDTKVRDKVVEKLGLNTTS